MYLGYHSEVLPILPERICNPFIYTHTYMCSIFNRKHTYAYDNLFNPFVYVYIYIYIYVYIYTHYIYIYTFIYIHTFTYIYVYIYIYIHIYIYRFTLNIYLMYIQIFMHTESVFNCIYIYIYKYLKTHMTLIYSPVSTSPRIPRSATARPKSVSCARKRNVWPCSTLALKC